MQHVSCDGRQVTLERWQVPSDRWQETGDQILWLRPKLFAEWVRSWLVKLTIPSGVRWMPLHIKLIKEIKILLGLSGFIYQTLLPKKGALKMLKASFRLESDRLHHETMDFLSLSTALHSCQTKRPLGADYRERLRFRHISRNDSESWPKFCLLPAGLL